MADQQKQPKEGGQPAQGGQQQAQIKASDKVLKGRYSNTAQVLHTKEEFVMDFLNVFPPSGTLNARVIVSTGHFKRIAKAMNENLKKYEEKFGKIDESKEDDEKIGFM